MNNSYKKEFLRKFIQKISDSDVGYNYIKNVWNICDVGSVVETTLA